MAANESPIATPRAQRVEDFKQRTLPLIVWCACALLAVGMLMSRAQRFECIGLASAATYEISSGERATVAAIPVVLYDAVRAGDVVAVLDDSQVRAEIETARANVRRLAAELDAAKAGLGGAAGPDGFASDARRFALDEDKQRLDALAIEVKLAADRVELDRQKLALRRAEALRSTGLISEADLDDARLLLEQVLSRTEENQRLLAETEEAMRRTQARRAEYERAGGGKEPAAFAPLREAINVEVRRVDEIEARRDALVLKSPVDGRVTGILATKGQAVIPGEPIVTLEETTVREVVSYLREGDTRTVTPNSKVRMTSTRSGKVIDSVVVGVGPGLQAMPQRLWKHPQIAEYGLGVTIATSPAMDLTPGEIVSVRFLGAR